MAKEEIKFNAQEFLLDFLEKFPNTIPDPENPKKEIPTSYEHIMIIEGDPNIVPNQLVGNTNIKVFDELTPAQFSLLTPKIEIYKHVPAKKGQVPRRIRYPISQITTEESILQSIEQRGTDVSLTEINWQDTGTDTATAGVTLKGVMKFSFQSFEGLFMWRVVDGADLSFGELTTNVGSKVSSANEKAIVDANEPFPIRIEVGWSTPEDPANELFTSYQIKQIREAQSILNVATNRSDISITESGKVDVTINFTGRFETSMYTKKYDLFWTDPSDRGMALKKQMIKRMRAVSGKLKGWHDSHDEAVAADDAFGTSQNKEQLEKTLTKLSDTIFNMQTQRLQSEWSKLLNIINSTIIGGGKKNDTTTGRLFSCAISNEKVKDYLALKAAIKDAESFKIQARRSKENQADNAHDAEVLKTFAENRKSMRNAISTAISRGPSETEKFQWRNKELKNEGESAQEKYKAAISAAKQYYTNLAAFSSVVDGEVMTRIDFFFLGDLIDAALKIIHERPIVEDDKCGPNVKNKKNPNRKTMYNLARVMLGSIIIQNPNNPDIQESLSLADIPISLDRFKLFWLEAVYGRRRGSYPLRHFLMEVCTKLVSSILSGTFYGSQRLMSANKIKLTTMPFKAGGVVDKIWTKNKTKRINISELLEQESHSSRKETGKSKRNVEYLYIYARGSQPFNDTEKSTYLFNKDSAIPHLFVGNSRGPVKKVDFKRKPIPGLLESSILRNREGARSQFLNADRYDCDVILFGNPFYKPGMSIYVDPRSLGLGLSVPDSAKKGVNSWAVDLGLGGYYTIVNVVNSIRSGHFETRLITYNEIGLGILQPVSKGKKVTGKKEKKNSIESKSGR